jgi:hypothetical protein
VYWRQQIAHWKLRRDFEYRDEFSGHVARRFVDRPTCGDECCKLNDLRHKLKPSSTPRATNRKPVLGALANSQAWKGELLDGGWPNDQTRTGLTLLSLP